MHAFSKSLEKVLSTQFFYNIILFSPKDINFQNGFFKPYEVIFCFKTIFQILFSRLAFPGNRCSGFPSQKHLLYSYMFRDW